MIIIDDLWPKFVKAQDFYKLKEFFALKSEAKDLSDKYLVSWGENSYKTRHSVIETGFFQDALHLDKHGLYEKASFNFPCARKIIEDFDAPKNWKSLDLKPKFGQPKESAPWDGVVIVCQHHNDRSILRAGSSNDYHRFLEKACEHYGKKAFLKKHPVTLGNPEEQQRIESIALRYGCEIGHVGDSILNKAESVVTYNSTYAIDALMKGKHVFQYAPGYFWQSGITQYTEGKFLAAKQIDLSYGDKFLDFLVWKYCFHSKSPIQNIVDIVRSFESGEDFFPLPVNLSYGSFIDKPNHLGGHCNITHVDEGSLLFLKEALGVKSILDIGCGPGGMKTICDNYDISWRGIDGDSSIANGSTIIHDFVKGPIKLDSFDLAWSTEFLEHVEEKYIDNIMSAFQSCDSVFVTHALPGKFGYHHVNCQPQEYWIEVFDKYGFDYNHRLTSQVRLHSTMKRDFVRETGMVFTKRVL